MTAIDDFIQAIESPCQKPSLTGESDKLQLSKLLEKGYMELKCSKGWILLPRHYTTNICALAKKALQCYNGLEESIKVNKVLMWMGPEAYVKHELHPNSALPTGKNAKKEKGQIAEKCPSKEKQILPTRDPVSRNKYPNPRRNFMKQLQTQKTARQTSQSTILTRSQYKLTL